MEVLGWHGYTCSADVWPVGRMVKFSKTTLEVAYGREIHIKFSGNSSGGHSCSRHTNLEWPFIVPSTRCTCVMIMLLASISFY